MSLRRSRGVLRIHFTVEDLARLRIAGQADVVCETVLSLQRLQDNDGGAVFDTWRRNVRSRVERSIGALPSSPGDVVAGAGCPLGGVGSVLRRYHDAAIAPMWATVTEQVNADRARRGRALLEGGCQGLLDSFRPVLRWNPPVLEGDHPGDDEIHLDGRGLVLVPSYFCWRTPLALVDAEPSPALVYPIEHPPPGRSAVVGGRPAKAAALASLVGHTRAALLEAIGDGCTTTELARRAGTSLASASQHASVLRNAGLVSTLRLGPAVVHSLTPLGTRLLHR